MDFSTRNAGWGGQQREFQQPHARTAAPRVWTVVVVGNEIRTHWGQLGGVLSPAVEKCVGVNIGKSNEMSPEVYALDRARELCRKKHWEGYREVLNGGFLDPPVEATIDFDNLPLSLSFYKPDNSMGPGLTKKALEGKVLYTRKRDGDAFVIARGDELPKLYTRRMLRQQKNETGSSWTWDDRFPHIVQRAAEIMPPQSILLGELIVDRHGKDDLKHVQSITKSLTPKSLVEQQLEGLPSFYCWDVAFWRGKDLVKTWPVRARFGLLHELHGGLIIQPIQLFDSSTFKTPHDALAFAKNEGWEGWVVVDPDGIYGDQAYNFKGKPDRPGAFCGKLKPAFEDDFIAIWDPDGVGPFQSLEHRGERSTKDRSGQGIACVSLYQWNSEEELTYISDVSSGMTDEMKTRMARPDIWPRVWKVEYSDRSYAKDVEEGEKPSNALRHGRFICERTDKTMTECLNMDL